MSLVFSVWSKLDNTLFGTIEWPIFKRSTRLNKHRGFIIWVSWTVCLERWETLVLHPTCFQLHCFYEHWIYSKKSLLEKCCSFILCIDERLHTSSFHILYLCRQKRLCKFYRNIDKISVCTLNSRITFFRKQMWGVLCSKDKSFYCVLFLCLACRTKPTFKGKCPFLCPISMTAWWNVDFCWGTSLKFCIRFLWILMLRRMKFIH